MHDLLISIDAMLDAAERLVASRQQTADDRTDSFDRDLTDLLARHLLETSRLLHRGEAMATARGGSLTAVGPDRAG